MRQPDPPEHRPLARSAGRRTIARVSFEFYLDQVETLRKRSLDQKLRGERGSMSEMVRDAIDAYLATTGDREG